MQMMRIILLWLMLSQGYLFHTNILSAQDTIRIGFSEFSETAIHRSAIIDARRQNVALAENRVSQARNNRYLPNLRLTTAHGLVPGVKSMDPDITPGQYYLDPNLENDWENWGIFTQAEISGIQPIFTWGAIGNIIRAAQKGAEAAQYEFKAESEKFSLQLFELYQSALLVNELNRLSDDAHSQLEKAEMELERLLEEGDENIQEKDVFEFRIFKEEFAAMQAELVQTEQFVRRAWNHVLAAGPNQIYTPKESFLDPVPVNLMDFGFYENSAFYNRLELKGIKAAEQAAEYGLQAARSQYYPNLVIGVSAGLGYTPNRPRQNNPFIRNTTNFMSARAGFGFQQNLNFWQLRNQVERSEIVRRQTGDFYDAAKEGILLEVSEHFKDAHTTLAKWNSKQRALQISNEWLRTEQIDLDIGFGNIKNLVDAVKKKMELEFEVTQLTFDLNMEMARLYRVAGLSLNEMILYDSK